MSDVEQGWTKEPWYVVGEIGEKGVGLGFKPTICTKTAYESNELGCVSLKELETTPQKYICDLRGSGREYGRPSCETAANAMRIVACVNACVGIPTADLASITALREENRRLRELLVSCRAEIRCLYQQLTNRRACEATGSVGSVLERIEIELSRQGGA